MSQKTFDELLKAREARQEADKNEAEIRQLKELQLEDELSDKLGKRGIHFEILNTEVGVFALRRPEFVTVKKFNALSSDARQEEAVINFVMPCLEYPTAAEFKTLVIDHSGVAWRCAAALLAMSAGNAKERSGKF